MTTEELRQAIEQELAAQGLPGDEERLDAYWAGYLDALRWVTARIDGVEGDGS